jgi:hypothetical protein
MIEIDVTDPTPTEYADRRPIAFARLRDDGAVDVYEPVRPDRPIRRIVLRLQPPPAPDESPWRLVERAARAIAEASEFPG